MAGARSGSRVEGAAFAPEAEVLAELKAIPGVTQVETQTFTFMSM